ncbi:MAG: hypothetical protein NC337_12965 [Roseburia sp.]|nr:hypothetical protein [Roseburia sp.]
MRMKTRTAWYSVLHMLVDGVCAMAMIGRFVPRADGHLLVLLYNFCAFALQMPIGALSDLLSVRTRRAAALTAAAGVLCTIAGALTHPIVLGLGNALFHVGGGVGTIEEDRERQWKGRGLGVFVAPGALGLYLGTLLAEKPSVWAWLWGAGLLMLLLCAGMLYGQMCGNSAVQNRQQEIIAAPAGCAAGTRACGWGTIGSAVCCFVVVVLRSYIGMAAAFPWKTTLAAGLLSVLAIVGGKMAGGFCGARYGYRRTAAISLLAAAVCWLFSGVQPAGILALFLFNMTMPITLYLMICGFPQMSGFAFGCLTFALFLGFLPEYFGIAPFNGGMAALNDGMAPSGGVAALNDGMAPSGGMVSGAMLESTVLPSLGSVLSLGLLLAAMGGGHEPLAQEGGCRGRIPD